MSREKLRVGILGAGWFASRRHVPDLKSMSEVEVVAACRRDEANLARFCDHFAIPERYTTYHRMLDEAELDAVVISTPHSHHYEQARDCLERGLHVLLEKPLALTAAEGEELCRMAEARKRVLLVALNPPYWSHCHLAREWVREGKLGQLEAVEITWLNSAGALFGREPLPEKLPGVVRPTIFRADAAEGGGGHLMDGGQHNISELIWIAGSNPVSVAASMDRLPVDMRASVSLCLENGVIASVVGITDSALGVRRASSIYSGSAGTVRIDVAPFRVTFLQPGKEPEVVEEADMPTTPSPSRDLVHCIRTGETPLGSATHALETTRTIERAYQAAGKSMDKG